MTLLLMYKKEYIYLESNATVLTTFAQNLDRLHPYKNIQVTHLHLNHKIF